MFASSLRPRRLLKSPTPFRWRVTVRLHRQFHASARRDVVKPFLLSDPGEGIKEVQIIQWFVEPGARVEQFDKIVEVQTDKASNEITSRFDGVIKKLHYDKDDVVQVGQALLDIDVQSEIAPENEAVSSPEPQPALSLETPPQKPQKAAEPYLEAEKLETQTFTKDPSSSVGRHSTLATPAVRGLLKELDLQITDIQGTGRDGRVTKEDVHAHIASKPTTSPPPGPQPPPPTAADTPQLETPTPLTPIQAAMYKTMTRSLTIPHFLYSDELDLTALSRLRTRLNTSLPPGTPKLSYLHFILKALSLALHTFPLLNARIETPPPSASSSTDPPQLIHRRVQNIGIAMATPQGLLVPNIKNTASLSINSIAAECSRLQTLALSTPHRLSPKDITGGTITVSNIGSIGGTYVSPLVVPTEVAILGLGKARTVPAFDEEGKVVRKEVMNFSWAADHRVVDGATVARCAEVVRGFVERPEGMMVVLR